MVILLIKWGWTKCQKTKPNIDAMKPTGLIRAGATLLFAGSGSVLDVNEQRQVWTASYLADKKAQIV